MYPLAFFMMLNLLRPNKLMRVFGAIFSGLGAIIAMYHVVIEKFPNLEATSCNINARCTDTWFESIGFIKIGEYSQGLLTIAGMSLTAFITVLVILYLTKEKKEIKNG